MTEPTPRGEESEFLRAFREVYEEGNRAWNAGDFERAYGGVPDDLRYDPAPAWPHARRLSGPHEVVAFFEDFRKTFPDAQAEILEFIEADQQTVIVGNHITGTGGTSGVRTTMEIWQVWEMPEGRPARVREFNDRDAALEGAGVENAATKEAR